MPASAAEGHPWCVERHEGGLRNAERSEGGLQHLGDQLLDAPARLGRVRALAIDGPSGAGKSTVAGDIVGVLRARGITVALVLTDHFATWEDPVAWWPRLRDGVLDKLARGEPGSYRKLDWTSGIPLPGDTVTVAPPDVLVLEGVSAGRAAIRPRLSLLCWVNGPDEHARLERAVARDGEPSRPRLLAWQAFERGWFAVDQTKVHANTTICRNR